jgi:transcriptional regulator with XRE-family HTH domain
VKIDHGPVSTFGDRLHAARLLRGIASTRLEEIIGISRGMVGRYERGERGVPNATTVDRIAQALQVRVRWLLDGEEPMEEGQPTGEAEDPRATARRVLLSAGAPAEVIDHVLRHPHAPTEPRPALWWIAWMVQVWQHFAISSYAHVLARRAPPPEFALAMLSLPIPSADQPTARPPPSAPSSGPTPPAKSTLRPVRAPEPEPEPPKPPPMEWKETKPVDSKPRFRR